MVFLKYTIQKAKCGCGGRGCGVVDRGPGSAYRDSKLLAFLRGCDWRTRHRIFNSWHVSRRSVFQRLMGPDELLPGRSALVYSGLTIPLPDAPAYLVKPPPPRRRMRQLTLPELIRGGGFKTKVARGGGGKTKVARGGGDKTKFARGGGGKLKVPRGCEL
jgi:hypothetical protein